MEFSESKLEIDMTGLTWWDEWQNKCSLCLEELDEEDCPIILWTKNGRKTIKLHTDCFMKRAKSVSKAIPNPYIHGPLREGKV